MAPRIHLEPPGTKVPSSRTTGLENILNFNYSSSSYIGQFCFIYNLKWEKQNQREDHFGTGHKKESWRTDSIFTSDQVCNIDLKCGEGSNVKMINFTFLLKWILNYINPTVYYINIHCLQIQATSKASNWQRIILDPTSMFNAAGYFFVQQLLHKTLTISQNLDGENITLLNVGRTCHLRL